MDYSVCNCQFCARVVPTGSPTFMMHDKPFCSVLCRDWFVRRYACVSLHHDTCHSQGYLRTEV